MAIRSENIYDIYRLISREIDTAFGEATARNDLLQRVASINAIPNQLELQGGPSVRIVARGGPTLVEPRLAIVASLHRR